MDNYIEKRFSYMNEMTIEELEELKSETTNEIENMLSILDDKNSSPEQKSEFTNTDLKYEKDKLEYIEYLIQKKNNKRI